MTNIEPIRVFHILAYKIHGKIHYGILNEMRGTDELPEPLKPYIVRTCYVYAGASADVIVASEEHALRTTHVDDAKPISEALRYVAGNMRFTIGNPQVEEN